MDFDESPQVQIVDQQVPEAEYEDNPYANLDNPFMQDTPGENVPTANLNKQ